MKKKILIAFIVLVCLAATGVALLFGINAYVKNVGANSIITPEEATKLKNVDCVLVLGCGVKADGTPSDMLSDRIKRGIELYKQGAAPKIMMSGDHGTKTYDEVNTMKQIAVDAGIPSSDVFMDHAGFSTYESMYRARDVFAADKIIIVTQEYHLPRALYIAKQLGIEAYGVTSDYGNTYGGQSLRENREILARCKDFVKVILKPKPTYLGEVIPVSGDGNLTND
ncbi:MAG: YdcF family protein [Clostridia bacterium]|nr:YdcF family protein [Clostridia bacterium]MBR2974069.1 YdcF family protein [Clostridia bacterium]